MKTSSLDAFLLLAATSRGGLPGSLAETVYCGDGPGPGPRGLRGFTGRRLGPWELGQAPDV